MLQFITTAFNAAATRFARPAILNEQGQTEPVNLRAQDVFTTTGISTEQHITAIGNAHGLTLNDLGGVNTEQLTAVEQIINALVNDFNNLTYLKSAAHNETTGTLTITREDNTTLDVLIPGLVSDAHIDSSTGELVIEFQGGGSVSVNLSSLIPIYTGSIGVHIQINVVDNQLLAVLRAGSVTNAELANMGANTIKGAQSAGQPQDLDPATVRSILNVANNAAALPTTVTQANAEAGTQTAVTSWTAQRVRQAVNAVTNAINTTLSNLTTAFNTHMDARNNPHNVTAQQAGADPTGSASAVQTNLTNHIGATGTAHGNSTAVAAGFMSSTDKSKLDGVANNANNYVHPSHPARNTALSGAAVYSNVTVDAQGHTAGLTTRNLTAANIGAQAPLNRTIGGNDNATGTVTDTSGNISVPIPVTVAAGTAANTLPGTGTLSLRSWLSTARNCLAWLVARFNTSGHATRAVTADTFTTARTINNVSFDGSANITVTANPNAHNHDAGNITTGTLNPGRLQMPTSTSTVNDIMPWRAAALPDTNLNNVRAPGFYQISVATSSSPAMPVTTGGTGNTAVLLVMSPTNSRITQVLFHNNNQIRYRTLQNTTWLAWQRIRAEVAGEVQTANITLTNTQAYPFNNSARSVSLSVPRQNSDYRVHILSVTGGGINQGNVGRVRIFNKLLNGFQIAFTGSASSVTVRYMVEGGMN